MRVPSQKATLVIDGPLAEFPYVKKTGSWSLDAEVSDADVFYAAGWPAIKGLGAALAFRSNGLDITSSKGSIADLKLEKVSAQFRDFDDNNLGIEGQISGDLANYYSVLANSPLRQRFDGLLKHTQARGPSRVALRLAIPLHDTDHPATCGRRAFEAAP